MLWVGAPTGVVAEIDLEEIGVTPNDVLLSRPGTRGPDDVREHARAAAREFLDSASPMPVGQDLGDVRDGLTVTDGNRSWDSAFLEGVTEADGTDPMWLRHRAMLNTAVLADETA
ncbi:hypothetical protein ABT160_41035 [Streptomyces sp. NPDC001941]|uniref:hypothetical protein n=1 Tax=Streptomyces sp. NPDC001941 TaxID=3154659 RepID=UPI00331A7DA6